MWECPICNREFRTKNQWHTCDMVSLESHFKSDLNGSLKETFNYLCDRISPLGEFKFEPVKSCIAIKKRSTFISVKVKGDHLEILFFLDHRYEVFPFVPTVQISKNKIIHLVSVDSLAEIDEIMPILQISHNTYFSDI